jgi:hypothetical protein
MIREHQREAELRRLEQSRLAADPRYVRDVVDFIWSKLLDRKLQRRDSLPIRERVRLDTLTGLCA